MSTDWKALCADLVKAVDNYDFDTESMVQDYSILDRARAALAQPEPAGPSLAHEAYIAFVQICKGNSDDAGTYEADEELVRRALKRLSDLELTRPAIEPVPVSERFEFSVFDSEYIEQAGGTAPTYSQALSEGQHYLAMYSQDGSHSLELRRVEVLPHHALPVPLQ